MSPREQEVLRWLSEGKTNGEIATILGISVHTVKRHVEKVLHKLGAPNRAAASACAAERDIGPSTYVAAPSRPLVYRA
jgi:DNA-binding CsgD family transcriptional regulator